MRKPPEAPARTPRVLVIDDDDLVRPTLVRVASHLGLEATGVADGAAGLAALRAQPAEWDLVLLDVEMPGMSGIEVLGEMKADAALRDIPVLVLSGSGQMAHVVRSIELGADDFIPKPFVQAVLKARIGSSLAKKQANDWKERYLKLLEEEEKKSQALIANVLPDSIAARLRSGHRAIADQVDDVSVLFADIVGFTPRAATMSPEALVALLNRIFSRLDDLAVARGLEKIKTVGDAYMIAGGLPEPRPGHLEAMADLALEMTTVIRSEHGLDLRIGLHCGPAIAGVIGRRKLFYDVWGDTINVASRLESHGVPGRVHVSSDVRARLEPAFVLEERGPIELKGRGRMVTHFVVARR
jgi:class 3 adenylate cyclase/CheY-like chemotaxis protein